MKKAPGTFKRHVSGSWRIPTLMDFLSHASLKSQEASSTDSNGCWEDQSPILKLMNNNMRSACSVLKVDGVQVIPATTWNDVWLKHELQFFQQWGWRWSNLSDACQMSLQCEAGNDISVRRAQLPLHRISTSLLWPFTEEAVYQLKCTLGKLGKGSAAVWASSHHWLNLTGEGIFRQLSPIKANRGRTSAFEG